MRPNFNKQLKTFVTIISVAAIVILSFPQQANGETQGLTGDSTKTKVLINAKLLLTRLDIINAVDKSGVSKNEKKLLRKEAKKIKGNLKELHGARYIPIGAVVIILFIPFSVYQLTE